ncbi:hypothetical protein GOV12_04285 [Candidatus Pacearchaeota archaeon]|nr:hypothetical protein [Candidatus Pacearchaeota archaeon]
MLINIENMFLIIIALIWMIGAVLQDLRRREVDNVWNFSLIGFALAYRLAVSAFNGDYLFILNGLIGLGVFFFLGNLFYYSRMFAGGDAKLLISLGAILPLSYNLITNLKIFGIFIIGFLILGSLYVLIWAIFLMIRNWKVFRKEFIKQWKRYEKMFLIFFIVIIVLMLILVILGISVFIVITGVILLFPILFIFAKSIEESCMVKGISPRKLTEGEWLYKDIRVGKKKIKASWEGVSSSELRLIKKNYKKKVLIKLGIPFTPSFLLGFLVLLFILYRYGMVLS